MRKPIITPNIETIADECVATISKEENLNKSGRLWREPMLATAKHIARNGKNRDFMLTLISTIDPNHHFFHIDYVPAGKFV